MADFEETGRQDIYTGDVFRLERRWVTGSRGVFQRDVVVHPGAVVLVPLIGAEVLLVRQWRHPMGFLTELPAGTLDPGETPLVTAGREIREETGFRAGELVSLGEAYAAPGYSTEMLHFFLARSLAPDPLPQPEEEGVAVVRMAFREAVTRAERTDFADAKTALGLLLADRWLKGIRSERGT